jgi:hypothetical protein
LLAICGAIIHRLEESKPMKALTLAAAFALALPGFALAQTGTHSPGASGFAPGHEQKTPGGAAAVSPGHEMQDARSARKTVTHGASDFSPGDKMNDKRGK